MVHSDTKICLLQWDIAIINSKMEITLFKVIIFFCKKKYRKIVTSFQSVISSHRDILFRGFYVIHVCSYRPYWFVQCQRCLLVFSFFITHLINFWLFHQDWPTFPCPLHPSCSLWARLLCFYSLGSCMSSAMSIQGY
jgi:hypothetical protein